jgi:ubiquinone/menaquinone biosynthesis C-methylase UbiE
MLKQAPPRTPDASDYLDRHIDFYVDPELASAFDEVSFWAAPFGALLLDHVPMGRGMRVLDLACGTGFPLMELAARLGTSSHCTGIDLLRDSLARARLKRRIFQRPDIGLAAADGARLPFRDAVFDLIVCNLGLNNFADPGAVLAECARVLRRGGRLMLTTNIRGHFSELYAMYREVLGEMGRPDYLERLRSEEEHRGTAHTLSAQLRKAGLRVSRRIEGRVTYRFTNGSALFRHPVVQVGFLPGWRSAIHPSDEPEAFGRLEARLNDVAARTGELRMTVPLLLLESARMLERAMDPGSPVASASQQNHEPDGC